MAVVVPKVGATIDPDRLKQLVKAHKGAAHAPKHIEVAAALPLTALGKLDKKALRAPYWDPSQRQVG